MPKGSRNILREKWKESLSSVLPVTAIVFAVCFFLVPVPTNALMGFAVGAVMLMLGMALFTLGTDMAMTPIGQHVGSALMKTKKLWLIAVVSFIVGALITLSEPDLQVLAEQVPGVPNMTLMLAVAIGVGVFLVLAILRILFRVRMAFLLLGFYVFLFLLAQFVPASFLAVAFDSGGVTTGPMTVPFIMALGVGAASIRSDPNAENDSFGLVALCSVGPILAVMLLGLLAQPDGASYVLKAAAQADTSTELSWQFLSALPQYAREVALALMPIAAFFILFQLALLRLRLAAVARILIGLLYTYAGLVLFLTGVNVGFMPVGTAIGQLLGGLSYRWVLVPIGMLVGYFVVSAEPAVHVLNKQVYEMTTGAIPPKALSVSLSVGVSASVGLAMLRILLDIPIMALLLPGYAIALALMFFVPPIFTSIAFDSGGVASGPMTATFLLPFAIGACVAVGGNVAEDAFGVVAMVAMTPLITIQLLGLYTRLKSRRQKPQAELPAEDIIEL